MENSIQNVFGSKDALKRSVNINTSTPKKDVKEEIEKPNMDDVFGSKDALKRSVNINTSTPKKDAGEEIEEPKIDDKVEVPELFEIPNKSVSVEAPVITPSDPEEKKEKTEHFATIKMENQLVDGTKQNDSTLTAPEKDSEEDGNNLQKKVQAVASNLQKKVESHNDKIKAFKAISKKLKKMQKMNDLEKALLKSYKKKDKEADPQDLSEGFRMPPKKQGLGLETVARCDGDSIKFEITGTKDRDDLAAFIGLTVSISGLKDNNALVDFVSAVRIVGFEEAVKHYNKHLKNKIKYYSSIRYVKPKHIEKMFFKTI